MKRFYLVAAIVLLVMNLTLLWKFTETKDTLVEYKFLNQSLLERIEERKVEVTDLKLQLSDNISINNNYLESSFFLEKFKNSKHQNNLTSDGKSIIFRIPANSCGSCVDQVISLIKGNEYQNRGKLIIAVQDSSLSFGKEFDDNMMLVQEELSIDFDKNQRPYFFSFNESFVTHDGHVPDETNIKLTKQYLDNILK